MRVWEDRSVFHRTGPPDSRTGPRSIKDLGPVRFFIYALKIKQNYSCSCTNSWHAAVSNWYYPLTTKLNKIFNVSDSLWYFLSLTKCCLDLYLSARRTGWWPEVHRMWLLGQNVTSICLHWDLKGVLCYWQSESVWKCLISPCFSSNYAFGQIKIINYHGRTSGRIWRSVRQIAHQVANFFLPDWR